MARMKKTTRFKVVAVLLLFVLMCIGLGILHVRATEEMRLTYEARLSEAERVIDDNTRTVFVATDNIKYGDIITAESITPITIVSTLDSTVFLTAEDIGATSLVSVPMGTVITRNMVSQAECDNSLRETQFDVFVLNSNLLDGNYVDVRIRYKNGEDYVVLTKKRVKSPSLHNAVCYMDMTEEETQLVASAIVDASVYGATLYTTTYIDPTIQEPSVVTYQPSKAVLEVLSNNPNILEIATKNLSATAREIMEKRLTAYNNTLDGKEGSTFNISDVPVLEEHSNIQGDYVGLEGEDE